METSGRTWPNFELIQALIHVLITCKYEKDPIKNSGENVMTSFSPLYAYGIFFIRSRAANSAVLGPIWPNFELVRDVIDVLVTCKYEEDPIKNEGARVQTTFPPIITLSVAMGTSGRIWPNFELIQALIHVLITCKYKRIQSKIAEKCDDIVFPIISLWDFFHTLKGSP